MNHVRLTSLPVASSLPEAATAARYEQFLREARLDEHAATPPADDLRLGVYVHVPFCTVRCPYCDFAVDDRRPDLIPHQRYAAAVRAELAARRAWFAPPGADAPKLVSLYFGGGTPGLLAPAALASIIAGVRAAFSTGPSVEVTLEANPGDLDPQALAAWRDAGVNRLSLGVQSFSDPLLRALGRSHDAASAHAALRAVRRAGFDNISADLMYGVPDQTLAMWKSDVETLLAAAPEHISAYALTVERGTTYGQLARVGRLPRPDDDAVGAMFEWARDRFAAAGYQQYEVSSWALPSRRAVHNALYWTGAPTLGLGASAVSLRCHRDGTAVRFANPRATDTYLRRTEAAGGHLLPARWELRSQADAEQEALWLGLRMVADGIDRAAHARRFGADPLNPARDEAARRCISAGWLDVTPERVRLTPAGVLFADEVAARLWT